MMEITTMPVPRSRSAFQSSPVVPSPSTVAFAQQLVHQLGDDGARFVLLDRETSKTTEIDETIYRLFHQLLVDLAQNRAVSIIPVDHELTTHQAAAMLNVSRPFVISLLDKGLIQYRMVGTHRRIRLEDLLAYKERLQEESDKAMQELAELAQKHNLGY
jgi:excisionase family DNA binding protein